MELDKTQNTTVRVIIDGNLEIIFSRHTFFQILDAFIEKRFELTY